MKEEISMVFVNFLSFKIGFILETKPINNIWKMLPEKYFKVGHPLRDFIQPCFLNGSFLINIAFYHSKITQEQELDPNNKKKILKNFGSMPVRNYAKFRENSFWKHPKSTGLVLENGSLNFWNFLIFYSTWLDE